MNESSSLSLVAHCGDCGWDGDTRGVLKKIVVGGTNPDNLSYFQNVRLSIP